jgi:MOSC domain-containing protein YiiM
VVTTNGRVRAISISKQKGMPKTNVPEANLEAGLGIVGDIHADGGHRQVSLLAAEEIEHLGEKGASIAPGEFAENITTQGLDLRTLKVGSRLKLGAVAELVVTQLGKRCHGRCAIYAKLGDCIMPRQGVFARVTASGPVRVGDIIEVVDDHSGHSDGQ